MPAPARPQLARVAALAPLPNRRMYSKRGWSYSPPKSGNASSPAATRPGRWPKLPRLLVPLHHPVLEARRPPRQWLPRLLVVTPLASAVLLLAGVAWYHFAFSGFAIQGTVLDSASGQPIAGARVWSTRATALTAQDGSFTIGGVKPPEAIDFEAAGHRAQTLSVTNPFSPPRNQALEPIGVEITAVDADTGQPVHAVLDDGQTASPRANLRVAPVQNGQRFNLRADGYIPAEAYYSGQDVLRVSLLPKLDGRVTDAATGKAVAEARVSFADTVLNTNADGAYRVEHRPSQGVLQVLAPGYRRAQIDLAQRPGLDVQLQPNPVRATYMTYFAIGGQDYRQDMFRLLDTTEVNAVVVDVKGDYGLLSYRSRVPLAEQIGANSSPTIDDLDGLLQSLHQRHAYVIGRIVVFKDNMLARNGSRAGLDLGVRDRRTGDIWVDGEGLGWVDPFQPAAWDYNTALAREAIERGFDEVQFDYVRFATDPSPDGSVDDIQYSQPLTQTNRVSALKDFLSQTHKDVNAAGGFLSMDTFGYTTWWDDDGGIGQDLEVLSDDIDYYCPMVYPSTFTAGVPGQQLAYPDVVSHPYDVVYQSLKHVQQKLAGKRAVVRPWLQYFDDYPWATNFRYDAPQIEAQKQAVADSNSLGWMFWNAGSLFKRGGLAPKS